MRPLARLSHVEHRTAVQYSTVLPQHPFLDTNEITLLLALSKCRHFMI